MQREQLIYLDQWNEDFYGQPNLICGSTACINRLGHCPIGIMKLWQTRKSDGPMRLRGPKDSMGHLPIQKGAKPVKWLTRNAKRN